MPKIVNQDSLWENWIDAFRSNGLLTANQLAEIGEFHYATANKYITLFESENLIARFGRNSKREILFGLSGNAADNAAKILPAKREIVAEFAEIDDEMTLSEMIHFTKKILGNLERMQLRMKEMTRSIS